MSGPESPPKWLHFPWEITYIILEHLGATVTMMMMIKALCLTAHEFWYPGQWALFMKIDIFTIWSNLDLQRPASGLLTALEMTPSLALITRHLTCHCEWDGNRNESSRTYVTEHMLLQLLPLFRSLQTI